MRTRSTSTSCASRRRFSAGAWRRRFSTTRTRACSTGTWPPPRSRLRSTTQTRTILGAGALRRAAEHPELTKTDAGYVWAGRDYPAARFGLRSASPDVFTVVETETGSVLGTIERERAYSTVHEGAIYLHLGESYRVVALDLVARSALVEPFTGDYYTQAKKETMTSIEETLRAETRLGLELAFGRVSVTEQVVGYQRKSIRDQSTLELVGLDLPETTFETEAVWYVPEAEQLEGLTDMPTLLGTLHAAEHAMIAILPLWAMCDRWDIGGLSTNIHYQTGRPTVFVYDGHSGGVGITERGLRHVRRLGRGHREAARRLPVRERLPILRAVAEVRQPERAARQGGSARAARPYARRVIQTMTAPLRRVFVRRPGTDVSRWREYGWRAEPDAARLAAEHEGLCDALAQAGAEVVVGETVAERKPRRDLRLRPRAHERLRRDPAQARQGVAA